MMMARTLPRSEGSASLTWCWLVASLASTCLVESLVQLPNRHGYPLIGVSKWRTFQSRASATLQKSHFPLDVGKPDEKEEPKDAERDIEAFLEILVPLSAPLVAFVSYEYVAEAFSSLIEFASSNNWFAVDGGALQAKVIAPAINGVVIPATTLLYATLTSTTISTLRQRQVDIRKAINFEAGELRYLCQLVQSYPKTKARDRCRAYLLQYTKRILNECLPHVSTADDVIDARRGMETELNDFLLQLHRGYDDSVPSHLADESLTAIGKLREQRLQRLTALQSTYPFLHYATLALLALAECTAFLMETNQDLLFFLNAFQLKLLWSILVGTFAACFTVFYDLLSPFSGSYQISASVDQIHGIRRLLAINIFTDEVDQTEAAAPNPPDGTTLNGESKGSKVSSLNGKRAGSRESD